MNATLTYARTASMTFRLTSDPTMLDIHRQWQVELNDFLSKDYSIPGSTDWSFSHRSSFSLDYELARMGIPEVLPLVITLFAMTIFVFFTLSKNPPFPFTNQEDEKM